MQSDPYARAILTFIALCLLVLVAQGLGLGEREEPELAEGRGQWSLQIIRTGLGGPPTLLRMNTATGEVSQTRLGASEGWTLVGVPKEAGAAPAAAPEGAAAPPAPAEAPAQP
jgi:hypothetical protein